MLNKKEVLSNFSEKFLEMTMTDPMSSNIFELLLRGHSPYQCLENLLTIRIQETKDLIERENNRPMKIILTTEEFDNFAKEHKLSKKTK